MFPFGGTLSGEICVAFKRMGVFVIKSLTANTPSLEAPGVSAAEAPAQIAVVVSRYLPAATDLRNSQSRRKIFFIESRNFAGYTAVGIVGALPCKSRSAML
jgi:hypothetical protein